MEYHGFCEITGFFNPPLCIPNCLFPTLCVWMMLCNFCTSCSSWLTFDEIVCVCAKLFTRNVKLSVTKTPKRKGPWMHDIWQQHLCIILPHPDQRVVPSSKTSWIIHEYILFYKLGIENKRSLEIKDIWWSFLILLCGVYINQNRSVYRCINLKLLFIATFSLILISFHFNFHSPPPERCHPLVHAMWPWPAGRSKGLQPRPIGNLWHPLHLPIKTNLSVFGDNLSMIQYLIVKWKLSSKKKEKTVLKKVVFSLFERKPMNPTSCTCPTAAWFCVSPTNQSFRDGDDTKLIANYQMNQMDARLNQKNTSSGIGCLQSNHSASKPLDFFHNFLQCVVSKGFNGMCGISMNFELLTSQQLPDRLPWCPDRYSTALLSPAVDDSWISFEWPRTPRYVTGGTIHPSQCKTRSLLRLSFKGGPPNGGFPYNFWVVKLLFLWLFLSPSDWKCWMGMIFTIKLVTRL